MARRLQSRTAFGKRLSEHSVWEQRVAEARIEIDCTRLLCLKAADLMDKVGNKAAKAEIAMPRGTPEREFVFGWHKTWGVLILLLALARLAVRLMNPPPPFPKDYPQWKRLVAVWTHRLFYFLLIVLPLTGLAAASGRAKDGWVQLQLGLRIPAIPGIPKDNEFHERKRESRKMEAA